MQNQSEAITGSRKSGIDLSDPVRKGAHRFFRALFRVNPESPAKVVNRVLNKDTLRLDTDVQFDECDFIGAGHEQLVFRVLYQGEEKALKVNQSSLLVHSDIASPKFRKIKSDYNRLQGLYADIPRLIPEECDVVLKIKLGLISHDAVGVLQPYIKGLMKCLFTGFESEQERQEYLADHPNLKSEIKEFAKKTVEKYDSEGWSINLYGHKLIMIVGEENPYLCIIDPHRIDTSESIQRLPEKYQRMYQNRLNTLRSLAS